MKLVKFGHLLGNNFPYLNIPFFTSLVEVGVIDKREKP